LGSLSGIFTASHGATVGFRMAASVVACVYVTGLIGLTIAPERRGLALAE